MKIDHMAFSGDFTPVLAKHSKSFNLIDTLAVGVDRIQRNFEPMQRQVESWRQNANNGWTGEVDLLLGVCGWQARCTKEPAARRSSVVLRAGIPGVRAANNVEPVERVHKRFQESSIRFLS
jgi:hypothetical protein